MPLVFDGLVTGIGAISYLNKWDQLEPVGDLFRGVELFALANIIDKLLRAAFIQVPAYSDNSSWIKHVSAAPLEELLYSGILLSTNKWCALPRFIASFAIGSTAVRTFTGPPQDNSTLSIDSKMGLCWAIARECLVQTMPTSYSLPLLILSDSLIAGINETCPSKNNPFLEVSVEGGQMTITPIARFSKSWIYRVASSTIFRLIATTSAATRGIFSSIVQHTLFNWSRC